MWPPLVTTGTAPLPMRISLILSSRSLVSGTLVDNKKATSGRVLRSFCTLDVASDIGGVNTSSTVSLSFSFSKPPSRMALVKLTGEAVLSITMPTDCGALPLACVANSDQINERGFKYVFQTSPSANTQAAAALPILVKLATQANGKPPQSVGIVMDNTASPVSFTKAMREGGFDREKLKLSVDEVFTPPMSDATSSVQKLRNARPDVAFLLSTNVPDTKLLLDKMSEMRIGNGAVPVVTNGGHMGAPELLKVMSKESLEGVMVVIANWGGKGHEALSTSYSKRMNEPWMTQDSMSTYGDMWIFKEAMEAAGSADRRKVAEAMRKMDTTEGAAKYYPGGRLKFDDKGRRVGAETVILQWRDGTPIPVYPPSLAVKAPLWPKR